MATDLSLLKSAVTSTLDLSGTAALDTANATAKGLEATGNTAEAGAYGSAIQIAEGNADIEQIAGSIQGIQEQRKAQQTIGQQRAAQAANGFTGDSGSAVAVLQDSLRQSYIAQQINDTQTQLTRGGFLEQGAASTAEQTAATAAAASATALSNSYTTAAATSTANAANETKAIEAVLAQDKLTNGPLTPEQQATQDVVTATLTSPLNGPATLPATADPATVAAASNVSPQFNFAGQIAASGARSTNLNQTVV